MPTQWSIGPRLCSLGRLAKTDRMMPIAHRPGRRCSSGMHGTRRQVLREAWSRCAECWSLLDQELKEIDADLSKRLRESPVWREREELLRSVPGVGPTRLTFTR